MVLGLYLDKGLGISKQKSVTNPPCASPRTLRGGLAVDMLSTAHESEG
jgi:hypothetical protein